MVMQHYNMMLFVVIYDQLSTSQCRMWINFSPQNKMHSTHPVAPLPWLKPEFGQVLMRVVNEAEGDGLLPMCSGLMERYQRAGEAPPQVLYVDRDCWSATGKGKPLSLRPLHETPHCLHLWMGCFRCGEAKGGQAVDRLPAHCQRMAKHCRRRTRGTQGTKQLIEKLLKDFMGAKDTIGLRLLDQERMQEIW